MTRFFIDQSNIVIQASNSRQGQESNGELRLACKEIFRRTTLKADFHSVEFSDWTGNPLFTCENVTLDLKRMLRVCNNLLCQIQSARKILLSGNQP